MSKIYTKVGDKGTTKTLSGKDVIKNSCLISINGDIDFLQSALDKVIHYVNKLPKEYEVDSYRLSNIQKLLWQMGGEISAEGDLSFIKTPITEEDVTNLEVWIDEKKLELSNFVRFTNFASMEVNEARVRVRHLERELVEYLYDKELRPEIFRFINRLSDYLFSLAVHIEDNFGGIDDGRR